MDQNNDTHKEDIVDAKEMEVGEVMDAEPAVESTEGKEEPAVSLPARDTHTGNPIRDPAAARPSPSPEKSSETGRELGHRPTLIFPSRDSHAPDQWPLANPQEGNSRGKIDNARTEDRPTDASRGRA